MVVDFISKESRYDNAVSRTYANVTLYRVTCNYITSFVGKSAVYDYPTVSTKVCLGQFLCAYHQCHRERSVIQLYVRSYAFRATLQ